MDKNVYSKRIVTFIDVLGFKNHIDKSIDNNNYAQHLLSVMKRIANIKDENDNGILSQKELGKEVTVFSDCIVISYPLDYEGSLFFILLDIIHIQLDLYFAKIVIRGGVTIGDLYHDDNIVFGPAMVEAYRLESKVAKYPRIIIEKDVLIEGIEKTTPSRHDFEMELEYLVNILIGDVENEELFILDVLTQESEFDDPSYLFDMLSKVRELIIEEFKVASDKRVIEKYEWLRDYFNTTLKRLGLKKMKIYKKDCKK